MVIDYDHNPNITEEQRVQSLKESVQMALNEMWSLVDNNGKIDPKYLPVYDGGVS